MVSFRLGTGFDGRFGRGTISRRLRGSSLPGSSTPCCLLGTGAGTGTGVGRGRFFLEGELFGMDCACGPGAGAGAVNPGSRWVSAIRLPRSTGRPSARSPRTNAHSFSTSNIWRACSETYSVGQAGSAWAKAMLGSLSNSNVNAPAIIIRPKSSEASLFRSFVRHSRITRFLQRGLSTSRMYHHTPRMTTRKRNAHHKDLKPRRTTRSSALIPVPRR